MNNIKDISPLKHCKELVDLNLAHIGPLYDFSPLVKHILIKVDNPKQGVILF